MVVVSHQTPCPNRPIEALGSPAQFVDKPLTVSIVEKNILPGFTARRRMVESAFKLDSKRAGHGPILAVEVSLRHVTRPDPRGTLHARYTT